MGATGALDGNVVLLCVGMDVGDRLGLVVVDLDGMFVGLEIRWLGIDVGEAVGKWVGK